MTTKTRKPDPMGSTFAERKAAREGGDFTPPEPTETGNTTFAERGGKPAKKAVDQDADGAENKAVAKKTAAKKS